MEAAVEMWGWKPGEEEVEVEATGRLGGGRETEGERVREGARCLPFPLPLGGSGEDDPLYESSEEEDDDDLLLLLPFVFAPSIQPHRSAAP